MQEAFKLNNLYLEALIWPTILKKKNTFKFVTKLVQIGPKTTVPNYCRTNCGPFWTILDHF